MSAVEKAKNVAQQAVGKAEEFVGKKTNDPEQVAQGQYDQGRGEERQHIEHAKDEIKKD